MLKRNLSALRATIADLWWSLEDRMPLQWAAAVLVLVAAAVGLKAIGWLAPVLYAIPIIACAVVGLLFASLALAFEDDGGDDLDDWLQMAIWTVIGGLIGWAVSAFVSWGVA